MRYKVYKMIESDDEKIILSEAKQKANEIIEKYKNAYDYDFMDKPISDYMARKYALICVELFEVNDYWKEVIKEIENF